MPGAWRGLSLLIAAHVVFAPIALADDPADAAGLRLFEEKIEPVLKIECYHCHSKNAEKLKGGLLLDSRAAMLKGGDTGPAVVPHKSDDSLLIQALRHEGGLAMPPKKPKLSDAAISGLCELGEPGRAAAA